LQLIQDFFKKHSLEEETIAIGVSGGADSLALVLLIKETLPKAKLVALTVDHGLRPTSRQEAEYVATLMEQHQIEHHILSWMGRKPKTGIEEAARVARYNLLCDWCLEHQVKYLAIAHHLFDQAETFLMRLERGSGLFGLSAMNEISERNNIKILRPFLYIHPDKLKAYLKNKGISWVEDESNQCTDFLRVKMRKFLPLLADETGITPERLGLAAQNLQRTRQFIEETVHDIINNKVHLWGKCGVSFDIAEFLSWHQELQFYVLSELMLTISGNVYVPEAEALQKLIAEIKRENFNGMTLGGVYIQKSDMHIWIIKEYRRVRTDISEQQWKDFEKEEPEVRGIKIPMKLRQALILEKNHKK